MNAALPKVTSAPVEFHRTYHLVQVQAEEQAKLDLPFRCNHERVSIGFEIVQQFKLIKEKFRVTPQKIKETFDGLQASDGIMPLIQGLVAKTE